MSYSYQGVVPTKSTSKTVTLFSRNPYEFDVVDVGECLMVEIHILDILFRIGNNGVLAAPIIGIKWIPSKENRSEDGKDVIFIPLSNPSTSIYSGGFQQRPYNIIKKESRYLRTNTQTLTFKLIDIFGNEPDFDFVHIRFLITNTNEIITSQNDKFLSQALTE